MVSLLLPTSVPTGMKEDELAASPPPLDVTEAVSIQTQPVGAKNLSPPQGFAIYCLNRRMVSAPRCAYR